MSLLLVQYTYETPTSPWSEIRVDMRGSGTSSGATNFNTLAGNPHASVLSATNLIDSTGASTTVSISTISTSNWVAYSGCSCTSNDSVSGITGGTVFLGASNAVYQSIHFNYGSITPARYDAAKPQYRISGLNPAITYTITMAGGKGSLGFDATNMQYRVSGATSSSTEIDGNASSITNSGVFTLQPNASGYIDIWINTMASGGGGTSDLAVLCALKITA